VTNGREVDLDLLADYIGGALDGTSEAAAVERLIADDPAWSRAYAETSDAMAAVSIDLGALRDNQDRMPAEVLGRLEAALTPVLPEEGGKVIELAPRRRWARHFAPVAVAAGVLVCVGLGVAVLRPGSDHRDNATSFSGGRGDSGAAPAAAPVSPELSAGEPAQKAAPKGEAGSPGAFAHDSITGTPPVLATGTDYTADTLTRLTDTARAAQAVPPATPSGSTAVPQQLRRLTDPAALTACLDEIRGAYGQPAAAVRLVDLARFDGSAAVVVLLPDRVWVSGPDCGRAGPDTRDSTPTQGR
jgi:hypothetical protein